MERSVNVIKSYWGGRVTSPFSSDYSITTQENTLQILKQKGRTSVCGFTHARRSPRLGRSCRMESVLLSAWEKHHCGLAVRKHLPDMIPYAEADCGRMRAAGELLSRVGDLPAQFWVTHWAVLATRAFAGASALQHTVQRTSACRRPPQPATLHVWCHTGLLQRWFWHHKKRAETARKTKELMNSSEAVFLPMTLVVRSGGTSILSWREKRLLGQEEFFLGRHHFNLKTTLHFLLVILSCNYETYCSEVILIMKINFLLKI